MMPRIWFSGPRILSGLVRPGISFNTRELAARRAPKIAIDTGLLVFRGPDGGLRIELTDDKTTELPDDAAAVYCVGFRTHTDAVEVRQGALARLAKHICDGWLTQLSVGQVLAAIRSETAALGTDATIARVRTGPEPPPPAYVPSFLLVVVAWTLIIIGALALIGWLASLVVGGAHAGTCWHYADGGNAVTACEDGSYTVRDQGGRVRQYGERNGGFERYPGQGERPVFERGDER